MPDKKKKPKVSKNLNTVIEKNVNKQVPQVPTSHAKGPPDKIGKVVDNSIQTGKPVIPKPDDGGDE
jgi:hypothetical protein